MMPGRGMMHGLLLHFPEWTQQSHGASLVGCCKCATGNIALTTHWQYSPHKPSHPAGKISGLNLLSPLGVMFSSICAWHKPGLWICTRVSW